MNIKKSFLCILLLFAAVCIKAVDKTIMIWDCFELQYQCKISKGSPFTDVSLSAIFRNTTSNTQVIVNGFYDGNPLAELIQVDKYE